MTAPTAANRAADDVQRSFDDYHHPFRQITRRARERFEHGDWDGIRRDTVGRLDLHEKSTGDTLEALRGDLGSQLADRELCFPLHGVDPAIDFTGANLPLPFRAGRWRAPACTPCAGRHPDLFTVDFWRGVQERNRGGEVLDFFPYASGNRRRELSPRRATRRSGTR